VFRLAVRCATTRACNHFSLALSDDGRESGRGRRTFLVPLPSGLDPDAPERFGSRDLRAAALGTYELRIGHELARFTAQASFGRAPLIRGVQHAPPALGCSAARLRPALTKPTRAAAVHRHTPQAPPPSTRLALLRKL
jgi:hypothetical protein